MSRFIETTIVVVSLLMIGYHLLVVWNPMFTNLLHQNFHLGFALAILFLVSMRSLKTGSLIVHFLGFLISIGVIAYMHIYHQRLQMWAGFPEPVDIIVGLLLVLIILYQTWFNWGSIFPILVILSVLYAIWGHHIPGALGHAYYDPKLILSDLAIGFSGTYGMMLNASANLIFLFIIFGSIFEVVGISNFFIEVGNYIGRYIRGGAAQTANFSSSFVGMCTGAAAANVALTGSYTIPLMKKCGFQPKHAGAIEAAASTGGQLTPPIMGVAIFLMASFLGVSYASLMATALIPALVYYLAIIFGAILIAFRDNIPMLDIPINRHLLLLGAPLFIIPMGLVTYLLIKRFTPAYAAFYAIFLLLALSLIRKDSRPPIGKLLKGLSRGAIMGAAIAVACASIGMFTSMLTSTGAGFKMATLIGDLSHGYLLIALILTMILSIILGCSMPTPVAYIIVAIVATPVLSEMGMSKITAHFFVFYFAILSAVTPPVAGAAIVGSRIAETDYLSTGWESLKLTAPFFLVPFFLARNPIVLSHGGQTFAEASLALVALAIGCCSMLFFCQGYFLTRLSLLTRAIFLFAAILATLFGQYSYTPFFGVSLLLFALLFIFQWRSWRTAPKKEVTQCAAKPL